MGPETASESNLGNPTEWSVDARDAVKARQLLEAGVGVVWPPIIEVEGTAQSPDNAVDADDLMVD